MFATNYSIDTITNKISTPDGGSCPHSLGCQIINLRLVPRNDAASFVWPLVAAGHDEAILISRIVHEIFGLAVTIRIMVIPRVRLVIYLWFRCEGEEVR